MARLSEMKPPVVSVIIPCYNNALTVSAAVQSALDQDMSESLEVIVIDDGSVDGSIDVLAAFAGKVKFLASQRRGGGGARNIGLSVARGRYVKFLDADDRLAPGAIQAQLQFSQIHDPRQQITYGYAIEIDQAGKEFGVRKSLPCPAGANRIAHAIRNSPLTSCPLHPIQALRKVNGFEESLPRGQETDLHFRLALAGYEFVYQDLPVYFYTIHDSHATNITSGGFTKFGHEFPFNYAMRFQSLAEDYLGKPLPSEVCRVLALMYWEAGRGVLRAGFGDTAAKCFKHSHLLDSTACSGSKCYKILSAFLGPFVAEALLCKLKGLRAKVPG